MTLVLLLVSLVLPRPAEGSLWVRKAWDWAVQGLQPWTAWLWPRPLVRDSISEAEQQQRRLQAWSDVHSGFSFEEAVANKTALDCECAGFQNHKIPDTDSGEPDKEVDSALCAKRPELDGICVWWIHRVHGEIQGDLPRTASYATGAAEKMADDDEEIMRETLLVVAATRGASGRLCGYTQGMNFIARNLMHLFSSALTGEQGKERKIYNGMMFLVGKVGPEYFFSENMDSVVRDKDFVLSVFATPSGNFRVRTDLEAVGAVLTQMIPPFLSRTVRNPEQVLKLWDVILENGKQGWISLLLAIVDQGCREPMEDEEKQACFEKFVSSTDVKRLIADFCAKLP